MHLGVSPAVSRGCILLEQMHFCVRSAASRGCIQRLRYAQGLEPVLLLQKSDDSCVSLFLSQYLYFRVYVFLECHVTTYRVVSL